MSALREIGDTRQIEGEPKRRWFCSPEADLIVWVDDSERPVGFQLCYDKHLQEHALTWREGRGFDHAAVDTGENMPTKYKGTPILVADGAFDTERITGLFDSASAELPAQIRTFVRERLAHYPEG